MSKWYGQLFEKEKGKKADVIHYSSVELYIMLDRGYNSSKASRYFVFCFNPEKQRGIGAPRNYEATPGED